METTRKGAEMTEKFTIYRTTPKGGLDSPVGSVIARDPQEALKVWADSMLRIDDYSIDSASADRVILCPRLSQHFYYTYRVVEISAENRNLSEVW